MKLKKKTILITGASTGLGEKISYEAAKEGATVILCARRTDLLEIVRVRCESLSGTDAFSYQLDVTSTKQIDDVLKCIREDVGEVDILVNNAGFGIFEEFSEFTDTDIKQMFDVNVLGLMYLTQRVAVQMIERTSGHILNIASIAGKIATPKSAVYSATKFAVIGFSNALRLELKPFNIHVTTVNPGPMETNFFDRADPSGNYLKNVHLFLTDASKLASKVVKAMIRPKREINQPKFMSLSAKAYTLFPAIGDLLAGDLLNKK